MGKASLIIGLVTLILALNYFFWIPVILLAILGLGLAVTALVKGKSLEKPNRQSRIWSVMGIVANGLAIATVIAFMVFFPTIMNQVDQEIKPDTLGNEMDEPTY